MTKFELPTNIRQIGTAGEGLKIYVEDYVCSYLRQFAESGGHTEKVAFLVGKYMIIDGAPYVFVNGAIQGAHSEYKDNMETFTPASYDHAQTELEKYFPGNEILGWMQSQPGYGIYLNPSYADYHMNNFTRPYQLLFVMDPVEKLNLFYTWNEGLNGIDEASGYFIYYDQNKGMQDYMNDNRVHKKPEARSEKQEVRGEKKPESKGIRLETRAQQMQKTETPRQRQKPMGNVKTTPAPMTAGERREGRSIEDMRRLSNLLIGLCAVLFITSFIMGAGLLQSDGRISALENAVVTIDSNNLIIADQIRYLNAQPVFAAQDWPIADHGDNHTTPHYETNTQPPTQAPITVAPQTPPATPPETPPATTEQTTAPDAAAVFANVPETYTIQPGDSLLGISRMFFGDGTMVGRIMEINEIADPDMITIGQVLVLPRE